MMLGLNKRERDVEIIERTTLNAWDEPRVRRAVEATGRKKLIIGGIATEVCLTFPSLAATAAGYDVCAAVDSSRHFSRNAAVTGVLRMLQAGVTVTNSGPIVMEMLNDNTDPKARDVYAALEMPHATLIPRCVLEKSISYLARSYSQMQWQQPQTMIFHN